jgi:hypothetical protein
MGGIPEASLPKLTKPFTQTDLAEQLSRLDVPVRSNLRH